MTNSKLIKTSLINAIGATIYVSAVAWLMSNGQKLFGKNDTILSGVAILLLFVISAAVTGFLILGRPVLMYLDGAKKEALKLFYLTIAGLATIAILIFISLIIF